MCGCSVFYPLEQNWQYSCKASYRFLKEEDASHIRDEPPIYEEGLWKKKKKKKSGLWIP